MFFFLIYVIFLKKIKKQETIDIQKKKDNTKNDPELGPFV